MSDDSSKPSIPSWQRSAPPPQDSVEQPDQIKEAVPPSMPITTLDAAMTDGKEAAAPAAISEHSTSTPLKSDASQSLEPRDFATFRGHDQAETQTPSAPPAQQSSTTPPIITYPEFLVNAHKPPPLITPSHVVTGIYIAGAAAALGYAASKWIITPMVEGLAAARHEFFTHSQSKVDDFNERLSKMVSKTPEQKGDVPSAVSDSDEASSEISDPTELYHRDMGTQTTPLPDRRSSFSSSDSDLDRPSKKVVIDTDQTTRLNSLQLHLETLLDSSDKVAASHKDRQADLEKLRHYLDQMLYTNSAMSKWYTEDDTVNGKKSGKGEDAIEMLKKDIRGVKGVLLSARRFPTYSMIHS